tara:strand:- start:3478 stop:4293 length:816 start_codon:yes stop_codon:yes gene_type:complete
MIKLSGAIGITILSKNMNDKIKKIYIFADNHNKDKYCSYNFSTGNNIKKFLDKKISKSNQILLEEVERIESQELKELWSENKHTVELKNLYLNNPNKIIPIDIRQYLYIVSWELLDSSEERDKNITLSNYLQNFEKFFNLEDVIPPLKNKLGNIKFKKTGISNYFKNLKNIFTKIKTNKILDQKIIELKKKNQGILKSIDDLASKIMDWYTIVCIFNTYNPTYLHAGLYHTSNIINLLVNDFQFNIYYKYGDTNIDSITDSDSCIEISEMV